MTTNRRTLAALLRPLHGYVEQITTRVDNQARAAGLTVEAGPGGARRYRDPRLDQLATRRAGRPAADGSYANVRSAAAGDTATAWSTPTLTVSASTAGAGWSR